MSDVGVLNGPATVPKELTITTDQEVKDGANRADDRRVVIIHPSDGDIRWAYGTTAANGFLLKKGNLIQIEASDSLPVTIRAFDNTTSTKVCIQEVG